MKNRLKEIREQHGMTQAELSKKTGLSRTTICKIESGIGADISTKTIAKIASVFCVPASEIFML